MYYMSYNFIIKSNEKQDDFKMFNINAYYILKFLTLKFRVRPRKRLRHTGLGLERVYAAPD